MVHRTFPVRSIRQDKDKREYGETPLGMKK